MKILVVDDDHLILGLLKQTLNLSGYSDVVLATSAEEAAQIIAHENPPFESMFLDMKMPGSDGDELCRWVRQLPDYRHIPIVMVTALGQKPDIDRAFGAGASDYVTKPLDLADFIFRVDKIKQKIDKGDLRPPKEIDMRLKSAVSGRTDFTKPMFVGNIPAEIELSAMEKYLLRLIKSGIRDMDAFSFSIKDAAKLHFVCSRELFVKILQATGMVIEEYLPTTQHFLAFAGYGAFAGVAHGLSDDENIRAEIEKNVQQALGGISVPSTTGGQIPIVPFMSAPQKLNFSNGQNALDALYRVIVDAEDRTKPALAVA